MFYAPPAWEYLPPTIVLNILGYLNHKDVLNCGLVCKKWYEVSRDELLWKELLFKTLMVDRSTYIARGRSWFKEFKRLYYHIPIVESETLTDHAHQVLHVSFSHNGKYFATTSKDGYVYVWNSSYPTTIKYYRDMKEFTWKYTQYSQFNESDTLLLVSGVHFGSSYSTSGEIAVFSLQDGFELRCRVVNKPYDIFGTWYSDQYLLSGDLQWLAHLVSTSILWINRASQEIDSEHVPVTHLKYKFYNRNASSIRAIMVANCLPNSENLDETNQQKSVNVVDQKAGGDLEEHGNPVSHRDINLPSASAQGNVPMRNSQIWKSPSDSLDYLTTIKYKPEYREVENEKGVFSSSDTTNSDENSSDDSESDDDSTTTNVEKESPTNTFGPVQTDKFLIFTTGYKTYTPHQIGFKRIKPFTFPPRIDPGPSLRERLIIHETRMAQRRSSSPPPEPNWLNYDAVADKFDKVDHVIDLHGHIIGMGLSPDHRYLYVNSRPWPLGYYISNPLDPPPIAQEIDIHVIDLVTLKQVGTMLRAHKAYTPNNECFFIFLDVCKEYVASGAEDKHGYLWDRHYGVCLAKFPHSDVVNSVAFNPKDSEMLITTSDDNTIKVWRSRSAVRKLGLKESSFNTGVEFLKMKRSRNNR